MDKNRNVASVAAHEVVRIDKRDTETKQVHHVGSITFGVTLILCGILYLVYEFIPTIEVLKLLCLWPCILIILGIEVLVANMQTGIKFVYDKAAIVMTALLICFAVAMAGLELFLQYPDRQMLLF